MPIRVYLPESEYGQTDDQTNREKTQNLFLKLHFIYLTINIFNLNKT